MLAIRPALPSDAPALRSLYLEHLAPTPPADPGSPAAWRAELSALLETPGVHLLVGVREGCAVSTVTLVVIRNLTHGLRPYAVMENVVTHASHRGNGYASALIARAADIARACGCYKIMLMTGSRRESTLRFYERCGFVRGEKTGLLMRL